MHACKQGHDPLGRKPAIRRWSAPAASWGGCQSRPGWRGTRRSSPAGGNRGKVGQAPFQRPELRRSEWGEAAACLAQWAYATSAPLLTQLHKQAGCHTDAAWLLKQPQACQHMPTLVTFFQPPNTSSSEDSTTCDRRHVKHRSRCRKAAGFEAAQQQQIHPRTAPPALKMARQAKQVEAHATPAAGGRRHLLIRGQHHQRSRQYAGACQRGAQQRCSQAGHAAEPHPRA